MCNRIRKGNTVFTPGQILQYRQMTRQVVSGVWGYERGNIFNIRNDTVARFWSASRNNRGIIEIDTFFEKGQEFGRTDNSSLILPVIYNAKGEFAIYTADSIGVVRPIHDRMPAILKDPDIWIDRAEMQLLSANEIKVIPKAA